MGNVLLALLGSAWVLSSSLAGSGLLLLPAILTIARQREARRVGEAVERVDESWELEPGPSRPRTSRVWLHPRLITALERIPQTRVREQGDSVLLAPPASAWLGLVGPIPPGSDSRS